MDRRTFMHSSAAAAISSLALPAALRAQEQPGPPTPGIVQATIAPPATGPDVSALVTPTARGKSLLIVDKMALKVAFHDAVSGDPQANFSLPSRPHEVLVARDGRTAYVSIYGDGIYGANPHPGNQIAVIDLTTRQCTGFLSTGQVWAPHGLAEAPDGTIWATCDIGEAVIGFDPVTRHSVGTIATGHKGGHWIAADMRSGKAWLSNRAGPGIVVVDLLKRAPAGRVETPAAVTGLSLAPDGKRLFAADDERPALLTVDTAQGKVSARTPLAGLPSSTAQGGDRERRVLASPDGRYVFVTDYPSAALVRIEVARPERQRLLLIQHGPMGMAISPDGRTLWACNHDAGTITIVDVASMTALRDFATEKGPENAVLLA